MLLVVVICTIAAPMHFIHGRNPETPLALEAVPWLVWAGMLAGVAIGSAAVWLPLRAGRRNLQTHCWIGDVLEVPFYSRGLRSDSLGLPNHRVRRPIDLLLRRESAHAEPHRPLADLRRHAHRTQHRRLRDRAFVTRRTRGRRD